MKLFAKVFSTRTLMQIVVVLTTTVAMKALSVHYDSVGPPLWRQAEEMKEAAN